MAAENASAQQRAGQSLIERLGNAQAVLGALTVPCIYRDRPTTDPLSGLQVRGRDISLRCLTAALAGVTVAEDTALTVYQGDQLTSPAGAYLVSAGGRFDDPQLGTTLLQLERA